MYSRFVYANYLEGEAAGPRGQKQKTTGERLLLCLVRGCGILLSRRTPSTSQIRQPSQPHPTSPRRTAGIKTGPPLPARPSQPPRPLPRFATWIGEYGTALPESVRPHRIARARPRRSGTTLGPSRPEGRRGPHGIRSIRPHTRPREGRRQSGVAVGPSA